MLTILYRLSPRPPLSLLFPYTTLFRSSMLHAKFVNIHPFADGNGRTSRLLMNLELMKTKYPPITIEKDERFKYRSEEHTSELQSRGQIVCRLLLQKKKTPVMK